MAWLIVVQVASKGVDATFNFLFGAGGLAAKRTAKRAGSGSVTA